ncbi:MAG: hypothetical protein ACO3D4_06675 [Vulcanococcus sp.]|jgi:hypothetical protein
MARSPRWAALSALALSTLALPTLPVPAGQAQELARASEVRLSFERTDRRLSRTGDPIWDLRVEIPGEPVRHFEAVSGRADRQGANRHQMGSEAPLPQGQYAIGAIEPLGRQDPSELGPIWIGIEPLFPTGRRVLGIHLDPSAGRNWNSGTGGCIGLIHRADMLNLAQLLKRSPVQSLVVNN